MATSPHPLRPATLNRTGPPAGRFGFQRRPGLAAAIRKDGGLSRPLSRSGVRVPEPSPDTRATVDGVACVNRAGLAQLTGRSAEWVNRAASPAQRPRTGCPEPVARRSLTGRAGPPEWWYPLEAAREWADQLAAAAPAPHRVPDPDDPDELIGVAQMRFEVMRPSPPLDTMKKYVRQLRRDQDAGKKSFLPPPAEWVTTSRGQSPRWRRGEAVAWQNSRPGRGRGPAMGRPPVDRHQPQPVSEPDDPDELIGESAFRTRIIQPPMSHTAWKRAIAASQADWDAGRDGVLPRYDDIEQVDAIGGPTTVYRWRAGKAAAWQNQRAAAAGAATT